MADFFKDLEYGTALEIEQLSRLTYELRENRTAVLTQYDAHDAAALLEQIGSGAVAEHPGYEHYLAARILEQTRDAARTLMADKLKETKRS